MSYTTFIQWNVTDLCMDFHCPECKEHSHYDGFFAYSIKCGGCGALWKMPDEIGPLLTKACPDDGPVLHALDDESEPQDRSST